MGIENSHWAIQLLNRFESGFSVDRPLVTAAINSNVTLSTIVLAVRQSCQKSETKIAMG